MALSGTLVGYWSHDETGTGTRADSTPNGLTLTNNNSCTNATGALNNATGFVAASSQYLSRASESLLQTGDTDWHLSVWVYSDSFGADRIIGSKSGEWLLYCTSGGEPKLYIDGFSKLLSWGANLSTATWYNITVWYDSAGNTVGMTVNNGTPVTSSHTWTNAATTDPVYFGQNGGGSYWNGRLDETAFAKFVPTSGDLSLYYNSGTPPGYSTLTAAGVVKTVDGLAFASVKTVNGLAIASVKTINGAATA